MKISQLQESTVPVLVERGPIRITLDVLVERISAQDDGYEPLLQASRTVEFEIDVLQQKRDLFSNPVWIAQQMTAENENPDAKAMAKFQRDMEKQIVELSQEFTAKQRERLLHQAKRLAYLVKSSDLTDDDGAPLPLTAENFLKYFSPQLIQQSLRKVEEAIFGPLVIAEPIES